MLLNGPLLINFREIRIKTQYSYKNMNLYKLFCINRNALAILNTLRQRKWPPFCRRHFKFIVLNESCSIWVGFDWFFRSGPISCQHWLVIIWTIDGLVYWHIDASLNEYIKSLYGHCSCQTANVVMLNIHAILSVIDIIVKSIECIEKFHLATISIIASKYRHSGNNRSSWLVIMA